MGIYDRDYERSYDTGSGWRDSYNQSEGIKNWSTNAKILLTLIVVYVLQALFKPDFTEIFALPSDWFMQPWRIYGLVTYGLLHDPDNIQHILFNGIVLFFFGRAIEARYGSREYLAYFTAAVVLAGIAWTLTELFAQSGGAILLGASGGISAVLVLFALHYPNQPVYIWGILPIPAWLLVGLAILGDVMGMFGVGRGNVAFSAHLGGAVFAYLYFRNNWRVSDWLPTEGFKMPSFKRRPNLKIHREEEDVADPLEQRVDAILRKIQEQGQESLTSEEQRILQRASKKYQKKNQ